VNKPMAIDSRVSCTTRGQAFCAGAWHGAKVGFVAFIAIVALVFVGIAVMAMLAPRIHEELVNDLALETLTILRILKGASGLVLFLVGFGILYGAVPGALIIGVIAAVRWRRADELSEPLSLSSDP